MATSRIIGEANRIFAEAFTDMFEDTTYALILGNKEQNSNGIVPETGSYASSINSFYGDIGAVLPEYSKPFPVCKHIPWKQMRFDSWDPTKTQEGQSYYCEHKNKVYLCLDNLDGAISGSPPEGTHATPFSTKDGYVWQYLYSITGLMHHYKRTLNGTAWMPVQPMLNKTERESLAATNAYFIKHEVEKFGADNGGALIKIVVQEEAKRNIRFDTIGDDMFQLMVSPKENIATIRPVFEHIGNAEESDANKRGYQLKRIDVVNRGAGYPMSASLSLGWEPSTASQNITGYDSTHIVGGGTSPLNSKIKGPFIYAIFSPPNGFGDAVGLLNANRSMFIVVLDPYSLRQHTDSTTWNTAALVKNAFYENKPIRDTFPPGKKSAQASYFSAANVIICADGAVSQAMTSGTSINSIAAAGNTKRMSATVSGTKTGIYGYRHLRLTGQGSGELELNDIIFESQAPDNVISAKMNFGPGGGSTVSDSVVVKGIEKSPLSYEKDKKDNWTEVIHTFEFSDITLDPDASIGNSLSVAFLIG